MCVRYGDVMVHEGEVKLVGSLEGVSCGVEDMVSF